MTHISAALIAPYVAATMRENHGSTVRFNSFPYKQPDDRHVGHHQLLDNQIAGNVLMRRLLLCLRNYVESPDPLANIANSIGVLIAINLPACALFLYAAVGVPGWTAWAVLLAMPFFAFVPAMTRRHSLAGRAMLPFVGIATVVFYVKLFGVGSAIELFLFPCVLLGTTLFRSGERWMAVPVLGLAFLVYGLNRYLEPLQPLTAEGQTAFAAMNAFSVAMLVAINGLMLSAILLERRV